MYLIYIHLIVDLNQTSEQMNFGKSFLASLLGSAVSFIVVGVILIFVFVGVLMSSFTGAFSSISERDTKVKDNSVLHFKIDGPFVERGQDRNMDIDIPIFGSPSRTGLNTVIKTLDKAAKDDRIEGVFLEIGRAGGSPSTLQDIRDAVVKFKDSGKWVVAFSEGYGQSGYYLASAADEVYLYPEGSMELHGLETELMFYKNMLDRLGVEVQVIRGPNNKYKSAVEGFILEEMSPENREQIEAFLNGIWDKMTRDMAESRGLTVERLNEIADGLLVRVGRHAEEFGLVDGLRYRDEVMDMILERSGLEEEEEEEKKDDDKPKIKKSVEERVRFVTLSNYSKAKLPDESDKKRKKKDDSERNKDRVAVVYAVGAIESGKGDDETIGSERISEALRKARLDERVKAVVLRVNSPGGSALASDVIWRETQLIKEAGKPFVVSMGDLAASGGYYISAAADKIFANETTITGSIGVFGMLPNMEGMLNDKIGLTFDRVRTNEHGTYMTLTRPLDEVEFAAINESVTEIYDVFLNVVAEGRGMTEEQVDAIAQGRVWTGTDAKEIGLVDELGNLNAAVAAAAEMAEIEDYKLRELPEMVDPFQEFLKELSGEAQAARVLEGVGLSERYLTPLMEARRMIDSRDRIQARLPYHLIFE